MDDPVGQNRFERNRAVGDYQGIQISGMDDWLKEIEARRAGVEAVSVTAAADFIAHAPTDIDRLADKVKLLRGLLRELEWTGDPNSGRDHCPVCPACGGYRPEADDEPNVGHKSDCRLAVELKSP